MLNLSQAPVGQIAIVCEDAARARTFYKDTLRVRHLFDAGPNVAFFESGGIRLMLSPAEGPAKGTSVLYFFVHDIETAARALKERGGLTAMA